jgi:chemotaxis protein CheD
MTSHGQDKPIQVTIQAGEYHCSRERVVITTLLGSCISACLYDPVRRVVGMNHFLLAANLNERPAPASAAEAGRYGGEAMAFVIDSMLKLGAERSNLKAKVFGGSSFFGGPGEHDSFFTVGEANCRFIQEFLRDQKIPLIASDMGGDQGRIIHFSSVDFSVRVRKIPKAKSPGVLNRERLLWKTVIEARLRAANALNLWT